MDDLQKIISNNIVKEKYNILLYVELVIIKKMAFLNGL